MELLRHKIRVATEELFKLSERTAEKLESIEYLESGYKMSNQLPDENDWEIFSRNGRFYGPDRHYWFRKKFRTPAEVKGKDVFVEIIMSNFKRDDLSAPQGLLYLNGEMVQGIDVNHPCVKLEYDTEYDLYLYMYSGLEDFSSELKMVLKLIDRNIIDLYYDISVPYNASLCFDKDDNRSIAIIKYLEFAVNMIDFRKPYSDDFFESIKASSEYMKNEFYENFCGNSSEIVSCIGHTHIDVAWLWTLAQTREKVQRSFSTVLNLMKQYPEYQFMSSQPQLYKFLKQEAPEVYEKVKQAVKDGSWEVEGAMWLEADCNLISGESLVRQIMYGKRFIKEEFGVDSKILWLPDVFGYSAAMPQILRKCGITKFVTSKISWNEFNKMPYDTFMWKGIDGTEVFTYFITARDLMKPGADETFATYADFTTYNGFIKPLQVAGTWERYQQKEYNNETIIPFGYGDGGGGPTADMLEQQRRLAFGIPGLPMTRISKVSESLDRIQKNFNESCKALRRTPRWVGELYLELHRGTYTSVAKNKRNNRKSEYLYQRLEALSVIDMLLCKGEYPQDVINENWETILLNQFHDIIPGSSIFEVYEDSDRQYEKVFGIGNREVSNKLINITANINTDGGLFVYNPNSFELNTAVKTENGYVYAKNVPALGWKVITPSVRQETVNVTANIIENELLRVVFNEKYSIVSIFDKEENRELIKEGFEANELQLFEDLPKYYDAWEITNYYKHKMWVIDDISGIEILNEGERAGLKIKRKYYNSEIVQSIYMYSNSKRIDFETEIDWHEEHVLLKAAFPFDINSDKATYDIQFGNIERPTHENTSWDAAKFEVCGHKWADISDGGYGVSLLNDCKYGYNAEGSTLKLSLLKCATYPNINADKGKHTFTYSIYPHKGNYREGGTIKEAYNLNQPPIAFNIGKQNGILPDTYSLIKCDCDNVIIETVKKAEETDDIIIRFYETSNKKTQAKFKLGFDVKEVVLCDMLENEISNISVMDNVFSIKVDGFGIDTVKLKLK